MKQRVILLFFILFFRFSLGWVESTRFENNTLVRVSGNINNIYQKESKCIIVVGRFWSVTEKDCYFSLNAKYRIVGKVKGGVIDRFLGRLWLNNAEISLFDENENLVEKMSNTQSILVFVRENIVGKYRKYLPEPESGLVAGIVLGYKKDIGQAFYEQMIKSGTIHIAVASGYNIMLVGGTVLSICFWIMNRKKASVVAILAMLFYALEAGGEPPVIRATVMAGVVFVAAIIGRKVISWWILLLAGWLMVLIEPLLLVNVSFQLSMAASFGLMVVEPLLRKILSTNHEKLEGVLAGSGVLTSLSTMVMTAPIIWWNFGRMTWISILSNILILPLVPILMFFGAAMQVLPNIFQYPTYIVAHFMVEVIRFFGL